ncbi:MAG: formate dehydrogenase accessory sulfurtransferase FdhD [Roseovarius sp.]|nr:formate dehydrogenase accessory sulfurtransferase FdhD [Roseovarius sp.]MCY4207532.1 formate dehydrogenase accessory sulfurtransferase FdhD [Roseovarius sp.]
MSILDNTNQYIVAPDISAAKLSRPVEAVDHNGRKTVIKVVEERPLTIFLNGREIVTVMTIGDYPEYLALGFLRNQGMLKDSETVIRVDHDEELECVVVRTDSQTNYEEKLKKKTRTSGCAVGTVFGDMMEGLESKSLPDMKLSVSDLYALSSTINRTPSLYLEAGAIHGTVLCRGARPLAFMEDVGRHNAVDKIAGWMFQENISADDKILYTTGRLTSEMVIKTALIGIPALVSRSGFTAWGVEIAREVGLTLVGRLRGKRFVCLSGEERLLRDADPGSVPDERPKNIGKGAQ